MKIQKSKQLLYFLYSCVTYHCTCMTVMGGDCMASSGQNSGSDIILMPLPSFLLLTLPVSPQPPKGLQGLQAAQMDSELSLPLFSLPASCSAFYSYFRLSNKDSVASKTFQHIKLL